MSTTPSEPKIRIRHRKNTVEPAHTSQEDAQNPEAAMLRAARSMVAENRSQKEIADHFGCDVRTVRRWIKKGREQQLAVYQEFSPEEEIAATLFDLGELRAQVASIGRAAMEAAVQPHPGKITPGIATLILRDRSNSPYVNEAVVANTAVLNSNVVNPAARTLWHSTAQQPQAPFGEMLPFSPGYSPVDAAALPADPRLGTPEMDREAHVVAEVRRAVRLFNEGKVEDAGAIWDALADSGEPLLEPHRLTWARARVRWTLGRWDEAAALLAALDGNDTPFDVRAHALVASGWAADRVDRREDAVRLYRQALVHLDTRPEYNPQLTIGPVRSWAAAGLKAPQTAGPPQETPHLQMVA